LKTDNINITELLGGVRVISENLPFVNSFSLGFWFSNGARDEDYENNGISHFIEHMVFKGTKKRTAKMISDEIESTGGYLNAFTSKEQTCFYGRGLSENLAKTFDVISDMIQNPVFREKDIKKEIGVVIDELNDIDDSPDELIFDKFEEIIFKKNPLSLPVIGTEKTIYSFNSHNVQNYFESNYSSNLLIVCSGNVRHKDLVNLAKKYLKKNFPANEVRRNIPDFESGTLHKFEKDFQQVHCIIGRSSYGYNNERRLLLNLLSTLLGDGSSSRLFQAVREKRGITYQIHSFLNSYFDVSSFGVYFSTNENQVKKVVDIVYNEMKKLKQKKISAKELNRVKEYLKGSMLLSLESTTNRMIRIANSMMYYNRFIPVEEILKKINAITINDIQELSNEVFDEKFLTQVYLTTKSNRKKTAA